MNKDERDRHEAITIADLYPELDEAKRREAEENLDRYLACALGIYERVKADALVRATALTLTARCPEVGSEVKGRNPPTPRKPTPPA